MGNRDSAPPGHAHTTWQCTKKNDCLHPPDTPNLLRHLRCAYPSDIINRNPAQNPSNADPLPGLGRGWLAEGLRRLRRGLAVGAGEAVV